ncbi:hypothetical protein NKR74_21950 [Bacillus sp. 3103sda1]|uniref:hypothetical protein n=1 Tax=Bacillus sp. 3103sda1 TaxID=2953808 RepID=UPI0020A22591|nr:hypothetical protein [Bacillus sp. 3103sda1]MCP1125937.1 hypothetical protein [Bacillus sp. 3103sda1]
MTKNKGQTQKQHEQQTQTLGDQLQAQGQQTIQGHTNDSPLNNTQTISTNVGGVTVNVNLECECNEKKKDRKHNRKKYGCSFEDCDCKFKEHDCSEKKKDRKHDRKKCECSFEDCDCKFKECECNEKKKTRKHNRKKCGCSFEDCDCKFKECDCCTASLSALLRMIQNAQTTIPTPADKQINIYVNTTTPLENPIPNPVITNVNDCATVTFKKAHLNTPILNTTLQINKITGISAVNNPVFDFLLATTNNCDSIKKETEHCDCKRNCKKYCSHTVGTELEATSNFGLKINLLVEGFPSIIDNIFVLKVCDCLAFFVDNLTTPTTIYVFSICSIVGFTVPPQTLG